MFQRDGEILSARTDVEVVEELTRLRSELRELKSASLESRLRRDAIMGPNLVVNHSFEDDMSGWYLQGATPPAVDTAEKIQGAYSAKLTTPAAIHSLCFPIATLHRYRVRARIKGSAATAAGMYLRMWCRTAYPDGGFINESNYSGYYDLIANGPFINAWGHYDAIFSTADSTFLWGAVSVYNWTSGPATAWVDDVYVTPASFTYQSLTLTGGWAAYGGGENPPNMLRNLNGTLTLGGSAAGGTIGSAMMTLPTGCRPGVTMRFPVNSNNAFGAVTIDTAGNVTPVAGSTTHFSLDGITFPTV